MRECVSVASEDIESREVLALLVVREDRNVMRQLVSLVVVLISVQEIPHPDVEAIKFVAFLDEMFEVFFIVHRGIKALIIEQERHKQVPSPVPRVRDHVKGLVAIVSQEPIIPSVEVDPEPGALGLQVHATEDPLG